MTSHARSWIKQQNRFRLTRQHVRFQSASNNCKKSFTKCLTKLEKPLTLTSNNSCVLLTNISFSFLWSTKPVTSIWWFRWMIDYAKCSSALTRPQALTQASGSDPGFRLWPRLQVRLWTSCLFFQLRRIHPLFFCEPEKEMRSRICFTQSGS